MLLTSTATTIHIFFPYKQDLHNNSTLSIQNIRHPILNFNPIRFKSKKKRKKKNSRKKSSSRNFKHWSKNETNYTQWFQLIEGALNTSSHNRDTDWWIGARRFKEYSLVMGLNVPRVDLNIDKQDSYIFTIEIDSFDSRFERKIHTLWIFPEKKCFKIK